MKNLVVQMKQSGYLSCDGNISKENIAEMRGPQKLDTERREAASIYHSLFAWFEAHGGLSKKSFEISLFSP